MAISLLQGVLEINFSDLASHTDFELSSARWLLKRELERRQVAEWVAPAAKVFNRFRIDFAALHLCSMTCLKSADKALAIERSRRLAREESIEYVKGMIAQYDLSLRELHIPKHPPPRKDAPKYRDPRNPYHTWSGRGKAPLWYSEARAHGLSENDLRGR
ncbi:H-NS histone family protein [Ralstonia pseudosolanacearum]|uniref:H-NS histone family protein n=1 Tax=Ralstonia pseudosolanacearum TaxID=1310165 RepID=UPI003CE68B04